MDSSLDCAVASGAMVAIRAIGAIWDLKSEEDAESKRKQEEARLINRLREHAKARNLYETFEEHEFRFTYETWSASLGRVGIIGELVLKRRYEDAADRQGTQERVP